jgi:hypothetical protein
MRSQLKKEREGKKFKKKKSTRCRDFSEKKRLPKENEMWIRM